MEKDQKNKAFTSFYSYPRHGKKATQLIQEYIKKVDLLIEVHDARIPAIASSLPLRQERKNKPTLLVFNKSDLSDFYWNKKWQEFYEKNKQPCLFISLKKKENLFKLKKKIQKYSRKKILFYKKKNIHFPCIKIIVLGLPNTGKSTLINFFIGRKKVNTGAKPGITMHSQWVRLAEKMEILDTPGILPLSIENEEMLYKLYFTGALQEKNQLNFFSLEYLFEKYEKLKLGIFDRYQITENLDLFQTIKQIQNKHPLSTENLYQKILLDFRQGKLGRFTLDYF